MDPTRCLAVVSQQPTAQEAVRELHRGLQGVENLQGLILYAGASHDALALKESMEQTFYGLPWLASTSCVGVGSKDRFSTDPVVAGLAWVGPDVRVGAATAAKVAGVVDGAALARTALERAKLDSKDANFAVLHGTPGGEGELLAGVASELPKDIKLVGGGAADNDLTGRWGVWGGDDGGNDHVGVLVGKWPFPVSAAYESGYLADGKRGYATYAEGRVLEEIDGRPAAEVYNEWTDGAIEPYMSGGQILAATTLMPLGIARGEFMGVSKYVLLHPERVHSNGSISLFTDIRTGEELHLMTTTPGALVSRASQVAERCLRHGRLRGDQVAGALMIYCGGCFLAVKDQGDDILADFGSQVPAPSVSAFTFGEFGSVVPGRLDHANLMASVLLFSKR